MSRTPVSGQRLYKIGQVAELCGLRTSVLRFWETEFPELAPERTRSGQRVYSERHVALVREIQRLLYDDKLTIAGAREALRRKGKRPGTIEAARAEVLALLDLVKDPSR